MTGRLWWNRLVNSVRFLDDVKDILIDGKSVILSFPDAIPWQEDLMDVLEERLPFLTDTHAFNRVDASGITKTPGEYLLEKYCSPKVRAAYWPNKSQAQFLASEEDVSLHRRILCITGLSTGNAAAWLDTVNDYLENRKSGDRCVFILNVQRANTNPSKHLGLVRYSDYITDYDCLMLCLTMLSSEKCSSMQKQYISEIASNIAHNNVEIAGILATAGLELARRPVETAAEVLVENGIKITDLQKRVKSGVWKAQIKLVFPYLEDFRSVMVQKYAPQIQKFLPITSSSGESVYKASEVEIGQLYYICKQGKFAEKSEFETLKLMREARNLLAHTDIMTFEQLRQLNIL